MVMYLTTCEDALSSRSLCRYVAEWPVVLQPTLETYVRFPMSSLPGRKPLRSATYGNQFAPPSCTAAMQLEALHSR